MLYSWEMGVYAHAMATGLRETRKGSVALVERPMVGEQILIDGEWRKIETIRHTGASLTLVLEKHYSNAL